MNIFDRIFAGRVIKDYGPLEERSLGLGRIRKSLLLAERRGRLKLVFKFSGFFLCTGSVYYMDVPLEKAEVLRRCLDEAEGIAGVKSRVG